MIEYIKKFLNRYNKEQKKTLALVGILSACVFLFLILSIAAFNRFVGVYSDSSRWVEVPNLVGMSLTDAKELLDKKGISYEIAPSDTKNSNRVERIDSYKANDNGTIQLSTTSTVTLYGNEVAKDKVIYLTFDDGPTLDNTDDILATLSEYGIKATFFLEGYDVYRYPDKVKATVDAGHLVGCHSYSHKYTDIYSSISAFTSEIAEYEKDLVKAIGQDAFDKMPKLIRFPGGTDNDYLSTAEAKEYIAATRNLGYKVYDWTALTGDADGSGRTDAQYFINTLSKSLNDAKAKGQDLIVLMHDKWSTNEALTKILDHLIAEGYYFDTLENCPEYTLVK